MMAKRVAWVAVYVRWDDAITSEDAASAALDQVTECLDAAMPGMVEDANIDIGRDNDWTYEDDEDDDDVHDVVILTPVDDDEPNTDPMDAGDAGPVGAAMTLWCMPTPWPTPTSRNRSGKTRTIRRHDEARGGRAR